jgi:hypothetical protein
MRALLVLLTLAVASAGYAVEPFVTLGVQPTVTFEQEFSDAFFSFGGAAAAGIRTGRREFYVEYAWKNSDIENSYGGYREYREDSLVTRSYYYSDRGIKDHRGKIGVRFTIAENSTHTVRSMIGGGLSLGTTTRVGSNSEYSYSYVDSSGFHTQYDGDDSYSAYMRYSRHSVGVFADMGSRLALYKNLSAMFGGQVSFNYAEFQYNFWGTALSDWYAYGEPTLYFTLRWDFGEKE